MINTSIANSSSFCSGSLRSTPAAPNAEVSGQVLLSAEARVQICNATGVREKGKERFPNEALVPHQHTPLCRAQDALVTHPKKMETMSHNYIDSGLL